MGANCAFCNDNAAANAVRRIPLEDRKAVSAFTRMFEDFDDGIEAIERASQGLPDKYPTHPQAEVLFLERIPPAYIRSVGFENDSDMKGWQAQQRGDVNAKLVIADAYFHQREYSLMKGWIS